MAESPTPPTVRCDACQQEFLVNLVEQPQSNGGVRRVMICPHCGHEYEVARITKRGRELQQRIDVLRAKQRTPAEQRRFERMLDQLRAEVKGPGEGQ